jgi:predicted transcriptional regulator
VAQEPRGTKSVLLRLEEDLADRLRAVAEVEDRSVSDVIRDAIAEHVERRRRDPAFQRKVAESMKRHQRLMRLLADDE